MATTKVGKWKTIMADPPWQRDQLGNFGAVKHYDLLTTEQIKAMPVEDLAADESHCYIWLTNSTILDGYDIMKKWGFTPRSLIVWWKPRLGLGHYYRLCTEFLLFGTKGRAPVKFKGQPNWMFCARQDHSHKPEEQYAMIERMSHPPYLELFARRRQPGWAAWGNEINSDIDIPGYPVPDSPATRKLKSIKKGAV